MNKPFIFFNHSGIGDVILTKPFCKQIKELLNIENIFYAHKHDVKITADLCDYFSIDNIPVNAHDTVVQTKDATYFNTFFAFNSNIASVSNKDTSRCYYEFLLDGFNYNLKLFRVTIDNNVDKLMLAPSAISHNRLTNLFPSLINEKLIKVLIYNQATFAGQSDNVGMQTLISSVAKRHPGVVFLISQDYNDELQNTINIRKKLFKTKNNLQELSTISKFCNIITGPANGPLFASWIRPNICNNRKTYITTITPDLDKGRTQYYAGQRSKNIIATSTIEMFNQLDNVLAISSV